ncbi:MAG: pantoate--beta-alanine ligase [Planctomycetota bacterium]|nr:MAG: pantoate--beta-alanine ligase [Planctomycetota bacterium]
MRIVTTRQQVRALRDEVASRGGRIGFVPTMGALHAGHLSLVERARRSCDTVVASVFVNPLQFGPGEDFERYPRDREGDAARLAAAGADVSWFAEVEDMYAPDHCSYVVQEGPALDLEGAARPTHFRGVLTVVLKLLNVLRPAQLFLGRKDYQQTVVIRRMVRDLDLETEVVVCPTVREPGGLAMSSRNAYLRPDERKRACVLWQAIEATQRAHAEGERDPERLERILRSPLEACPGLTLEYAVVRDGETLQPLRGPVERGVCLVAARLGAARLIDNGLLPAAAPDPVLDPAQWAARLQTDG